MTKQIIKPAYARFDPAHVFDGLFVPTSGFKRLVNPHTKKKQRYPLKIDPKPFGNIKVGFQCIEQLGVDDQSILLAVSAQLGIDGLVINAEPPGKVSKQLRLNLKFSHDDGAELASKRTTLRSLMIDAGYKNPESGAALQRTRESLNRLANAQIIEENTETGWNRRCNILGTNFNIKTGEMFVVVNPRLTSAVFSGQCVKISLFERNELEKEVHKLLHCWLCSNIRLGQALGNGRGARIDTLIPHVWGPNMDVSKKVLSVRRGQIREALEEIKHKTERLNGGYGWLIDIKKKAGLVHVARPKQLPRQEQDFGLTPSDIYPAPD